MSIADIKYNNLIQRIYDDGEWDKGEKVRTVYDDGRPAYTKSLFGVQVEFEEGELPLITSKQVAVKTAVTEMYLFWILQTTKAKDFDDHKCHIWREWYGEYDGEYGIGRSYGHQLKKSKQVERLIEGLKNNPKSRRHLVSYWNEEDKPYKALQECAWSMQFNVRKDKLDMILIQRSVDTMLGLPFNWIGYHTVQVMLAKSLGYKVGRFIHQMGSVHYYDRHEESALELIKSPTYDQPNLWVNPNKSDFFDFTPDDVKVFNYKNNGKRMFEVAI